MKRIVNYALHCVAVIGLLLLGHLVVFWPIARYMCADSYVVGSLKVELVDKRDYSCIIRTSLIYPLMLREQAMAVQYADPEKSARILKQDSKGEQ